MAYNVRRQTLLFLCPCTPDPSGTGWEQRAFSFLSAYSALMDVELWFRPTYDNADLLRAAKLSSVCKTATAFYPQRLAHDAGMRNTLIRALSSCDSVHVFRFHEIIDALDHQSILWDIDELPWQLRDRPRNSGMQPIAPDELKLAMTKLTARAHKCKVVFSCSALEQIETLPPFAVIPNCVRHPESTPTAKASHSLLFVGNMNFPPNIDALAVFVASILPLLPADVRFRVAGRSPANRDLRESLDAFGADKRIEFCYDVPSCSPHYSKAAASVVPLRLGGGTRIKIIESFAHRCPVVSTSKGCEGLAVVNGRELLIEDTPAGFAAACRTLMREPDLAARLSQTAYEFYSTNHSQEVVNDLLRGVIETTVLR